MNTDFFKMHPNNFVPITKTPWAGKKIAQLKKKYFFNSPLNIPEFIGESWEVSTDEAFPSYISAAHNESVKLIDILQASPETILGEKIAKKYGAHSPLLLKWLNAADNLSVQLHPKNGNPLLKANECGKPESWLILDVEEYGAVYLGFKENLTQAQIQNYLLNDQPEKCLNKYKPKKNDYISIPPGCVHAVGPGVFIAEPQYVLPGKSGKTWRISDWQRKYDTAGKLSEFGSPRELHVEESLSAIDWSLPHGAALENMLVQTMSNGLIFAGSEINPFALQIFCQSQHTKYVPLIKDSFSLASVWGGEVTLKSENNTITLHGGESVLISAAVKEISVTLNNKIDEPKIAFFALNDEVI